MIDTVVGTDLGLVRGLEQGDIVSFRGIPFAAAPEGIGAGHGVDLPFTFGNGTSRFAARLLGSPPPADFGPLSEQIRAAWTTFAATGDPGWPRFDLEHRTTRIWDTTPADAEDPLADSRIWQRAMAAGPIAQASAARS